MIDLIKPYVTYAGLIIIAGVLTYSHMQAYQAGEASIQAKFDSYKDNINDQVQKAKDEKLRIEAEQNAKYDAARADYLDANRKLRDALDRLRKPQIVPRDGSMPVAGSSSNNLPGSSENTSGTNSTTSLATGACQNTEFYKLALMDTLQCSQLIELITSDK